VTLDRQEKAELLKRYSERLAQHGPTIAALGWTKPKHNLRYRILLEYWLPAERPLRVLDFGCGFGDLYGYAVRQGIELDYTGLDINADLIRVAQDRYPNARFICRDAFTESFDEQFDVVLASGVHNFRVADNAEFNKESFELFNRLSVFGFAVNFLSNRVNFEAKDIYYASPEEILGLTMQFTSRAALRHDYMPFEFTVFADKRNKFDPDLTVFLPFVKDCSE
jgi:SAM-dependent methyltransferase